MGGWNRGAVLRIDTIAYPKYYVVVRCNNSLDGCVAIQTRENQSYSPEVNTGNSFEGG